MSTNTEKMINVIAQEMDRLGYGLHESHAQSIWLKIQAEQHQGEPVGMLLIDEYFDNREVGEVDVQLDSKVCEQLAEKYPGQSLPIYAHPAPADPGEVERLRADVETMRRKNNEYWHESEALRAEIKRLRAEPIGRNAQLAGRDALLREIKDHGSFWKQRADLVQRVDEVLAGVVPVERDELTRMVDSAMVEMAGIYPPLKRSECERLIRAALERRA